MRRLVVLRPEPGATETLKRARGLGLDAVAVPLFQLEPVEWKTPEGPFEGVLLTSANAVRQAGDKLQDLRALPAYVVGDATAEAARDAGFDIAATGDDGIERLLGSIDPGLRLVHPCGADRTAAPDARQKISSVVVYRAKAIDAPALNEVNGNVVMVHSPRAGARLCELIKDRSSAAVVAISKAAADAVGDGWAVVQTASRPTDEAMLALAADLCNKPQP